jgi:hypothetical protein
MPRSLRPTDAPAALDDAAGPVPPANAPGHHPDAEQDKPRRRPPRPRRGRADAGPSGDRQRFEFAFAGPAGALATAFTVGGRAFVDIEDGALTVRYGPWCLATPLTNVSSASVTGPYRLWKVAGPPHISLRDRGITFGTSTDRGVCIRFHHAVHAVEPIGLLRHPGVTVTVQDPEALVAALGD